jgi:hypothetical protein
MKPGGGKRKGSAFEREVGKILTAAYYPDGDGIFQRIYSHPIPKKSEVRGDLVALKYILVDGGRQLVVDSSWPFAVECKCWKEIKYPFCGLYAQESEIFGWMEQASEVAANEKKMPFVVFRLYRAAIAVMIRGGDHYRLEEMFGEYAKRVYAVTKRHAGARESTKLVFMLLGDFLDWVDWGVFKLSGYGKYIRTIAPKKE